MNRQDDESGSAAPAVSSRRSRMIAGILLASAVLVAVVCFVWFQHWQPALPLTDDDLTHVEPAVAELLREGMRAVQDRPRSGQAWGRLGQLLRAHGLDEQADECFKMARRYDPAEPRWPYLQALRLVLVDPQAAIPLLEEAVSLCSQPEHCMAIRLRLAEALLQTGGYDAVEQQCKAVLDIDRNSVRAHYLLGVVAKSRGEHDRCLRELLPCANSPFARKKASAQIAATYQQMGDVAAAQEFSQAASWSPPDLPWPDPLIAEYMQLESGRQSYFVLAESLESDGRLTESIEVLREVAERGADAHAYLALGTALAKAGKNDDAARILGAALQMDPHRVQAHYYLGVVRYFQAEQRMPASDSADDQLKAAVEHLKMATELKADHGLAWLYLGLAQKQQGRKAEALDALTMAVKCRPEFAETHLELGRLLAELGQQEQAITSLERAKKRAAAGDGRADAELAAIKAF